jgi:hypothetical protein
MNKQHKNWIGVGGFDWAIKSSLHLVDAYLTLLDESGARVAMLWLNKEPIVPKVHILSSLKISLNIMVLKCIVTPSCSPGSNASFKKYQDGKAIPDSSRFGW